MLGRIEVGFGEKLSNLHEGYVGLRNTFDRFPQHSAEEKEAIQVGKDVINEKEQEMKSLIDDLINRAQLAEDEKKSFIRELEKKNLELQDAKNKLSELNTPTAPIIDLAAELAMHIAYRISANFPNRRFNIATIHDAIESIIDDLHPEAAEDLEKFRDAKNRISLKLRNRILNSLKIIQSDLQN